MVSTGIGVGVWVATDSPLAVPVAVAAGVLIDADHVTDYFDLPRLSNRKYMLRYFHAWEYSLVGLVALSTFWYHPLLLAAVLGHLSHLLIDQVTNRIHPLAYLIVYRASRGFKRVHLTPYWVERSSMLTDESIPLWGRMEPWLWRLVCTVRGRRR
ncbi:MAG: hypothetical protein IIB15_00530 [Chloroflexi bacterium]|nr:hypothetical protein [Chloroflexota bacterium]